MKQFAIRIVFLTSYASAHSPKNVNLHIHMTEEDVCVVKYGELSVTSKLKGLCLFNQKYNLPRTRTINGQAYFLLVGKPAGKEFLSNWNVAESEMCSDRAQLVSIVEEKPVVSDAILRGMLICPYTHIDNIVYQSTTKGKVIGLIADLYGLKS